MSIRIPENCWNIEKNCSIWKQRISSVLKNDDSCVRKNDGILFTKFVSELIEPIDTFLKKTDPENKDVK